MSEVKSESAKKNEDWMNTKWRPAMGWSYMLTCLTDFVLFPVLWSVVQVVGGGEVKSQWNPITLQGAGLYHVAMGAVLGIAAWSRGQEKMAGVANTPSLGGGMTPTSLGAPPVNHSFNAPSMQQASFNPSPAPIPTFTSTTVTTGYGGKLAPPPAFQPEI